MKSQAPSTVNQAVWSGPRPAGRSASRPRGPAERKRHQNWDFLLLASAGLILVSVGRLHSFFPVLAAFRPGLVLFGVGVLALGSSYRGVRQIQYLKTPLGYLMAFFVGWAVLGVPFGIYGGNSLRYLLEDFLRNVAVVVIVASSVRGPADLRRLFHVYAFGAIAFSILASGPGGGRNLGGGGYDPNDSAMFIVSALPLIAFFFGQSRNWFWKVFYAVGLAVCATAIVLSGSRGGFLGLVAVLTFSLFFLKGIRPAVRVAVVAAAVVILAFQASSGYWERMETIGAEDDYNRTSYTGRMNIWTRGVGYMMDNPVTGVGIHNFSVAEGRHPAAVAMLSSGKGVKFSAPHSIWVQAGAELGLPGLLAFIGLFGLSATVVRRQIRLVRRIRDPVHRRAMQELGQLGMPLLGMLIGAAVTGTFLSNAYSGLLWIVFALVLAFSKVQRIGIRRALWR